MVSVVLSGIVAVAAVLSSSMQASATYYHGGHRRPNFPVTYSHHKSQKQGNLYGRLVELKKRVDALEKHNVDQQDQIDRLLAFAALPQNGDVRLVGGADNNEGRVEVFLNGAWGTVCENGWTATDAAVICNQLNLPSGNAQALGGTLAPVHSFGQGTGQIWLSQVNCIGTEAWIMQCPTGVGMAATGCTHANDVGVRCTDTV